MIDACQKPEVARKLEAFVFGRLEGPEKEEVELHLLDCPHCAGRTGAAQEILDLSRRNAPWLVARYLPPRVLRELRKTLSSGPEPVVRPFPSRLPPLRAWTWAGVLSGWVLAAVLVSWVLLIEGRQPLLVDRHERIYFEATRTGAGADTVTLPEEESTVLLDLDLAGLLPAGDRCRVLLYGNDGRILWESPDTRVRADGTIGITVRGKFLRDGRYRLQIVSLDADGREIPGPDREFTVRRE